MPEKPYDRCLNCPNLGVRCDGPNFLAMTIDRWIEWCRKRKDFLGWTNYVVSCESDVPESTVNRILSGASKDIRVTTMQAITKALINGTWGQYPCADPNSNAAEECERLKKQLEQLEKVYAESLFTAIPSITGMPAMVTKGVQLIADSYKESVLLSIAKSVEV